MSETKDDDLTLRDKFAIEILQTFFSNTKSVDTVHDFINLFDSKNKSEEKEIKFIFNKMERRIRAAYKLADMMRKIRLSTFE